MSPATQTVVVALIGLFFAWRAIARYAPKSAWRLQARLAYAFEAPSRPARMRAVGRWLRPRELVVGGGCGSGCPSCNGCATPAPPRRALDLTLLP